MRRAHWRLQGAEPPPPYPKGYPIAMSTLGTPITADRPPITCFLATSGDGFPPGLLDAISGLFGGILPPQMAIAASTPQGGGAAAEPPAAGTDAPEGEKKVRRAALPRGEAERRARAFLEEHRGEAFTPLQIERAIGAHGVRDLMLRLLAAGAVEQAQDKPVAYRMPKGRRRRA